MLENILPPPGSSSALPLQYLPMLEYPKSSSTAIALRSKKNQKCLNYTRVRMMREL
ncbi:MAG: hypothetical protein ACKPKO_12625 [Candidatus Fonsibacter sp.]